MRIADAVPEEYLVQISDPAPSYLAELERETFLKIPKPQMLSGFIQGRILSFLSKMMQPGRILELGTFTGYGTLCLAEGLLPNGHLFTIDNSEENTWLARKYAAISPFQNQITFQLGDGLEEVLKLKDQVWDMVYIDADKRRNQVYLETIWPNIRPGGLALIDNTFANGQVWDDPENQKGFVKSVAEMNLALPGLLPESEVTIFPIRDGLTLIRKKFPAKST
jgi:caffeoyl-CoA O-methyltransferase